MNMKRNLILEHANVGIIGEYIRSTEDIECTSIEDDAEYISESMYEKICETLHRNMDDKETQYCIEKIKDYTNHRETLYFVYGMRVGVRLLRDLEGKETA